MAAVIHTSTVYALGSHCWFRPSSSFCANSFSPIYASTCFSSRRWERSRTPLDASACTTGRISSTAPQRRLALWLNCKWNSVNYSTAWWCSMDSRAWRTSQRFGIHWSSGYVIAILVVSLRMAMEMDFVDALSSLELIGWLRKWLPLCDADDIGLSWKPNPNNTSKHTN